MTIPPQAGERAEASKWPAILGRQLKLMAELESRFRSGNSVPVERTFLTRTEFDGMQEYMLEEEDISTMMGMANLRLQERSEATLSALRALLVAKWGTPEYDAAVKAAIAALDSEESR